MNKNKQIPKISVVMAINRMDDYVSKAVNSILNQSFINFEFIIVINGDKKKLKYYFDNLKNKDKRLRIYESEIQQLQFNLNYAIELAEADIIARMDSDDIAEANRLEEQYNYLKKNNLDLLGSDFYYIDENDHILRKKTPRVRKNEEIRKKLRYHCVFCHPTIMFRKEILLDVGGYCFGSISEDWDLFLRLSRNSKLRFGIIDSKLLKYRIHNKQMSKQNHRVAMLTISFLYLREMIIQKDFSYIKGLILYSILTTPIYKVLKSIKNKFERKLI